RRWVGIWTRGGGRESADDEFLEEIGGSVRADADQRGFHGEAEAVAVLSRVIEIGDAASGQASENAGVVRLPVTVIALADHGVGEGEKNAGSRGAVASVEITRVLLEQGGQDGAADKCTRDGIAVLRAKALGVSLGTLAVAAEIALRLLHSRDNASYGEVDRVN